MNESELELDLDELESAEDFLNYFEVHFDQHIVHVNRLHILQRFHNYTAADEEMQSLDEAAQRERYKLHLTHAYHDFVESDALTEKVFKVFRMHEPQTTVVPLDQLFK